MASDFVAVAGVGTRCSSIWCGAVPIATRGVLVVSRWSDRATWLLWANAIFFGQPGEASQGDQTQVKASLMLRLRTSPNPNDLDG